MFYDNIDESEVVHTSKNYQHLKELLDEGKEVAVRIQILPYGYRKYNCIAKKGEENGQKFYSVGFGNVYTDDAFFRQCEFLKLELIEPDEKALDEKLDEISEDTANELINAFDNLNRSLDDYNVLMNKAFPRMLRNLTIDIVLKTIDKYIYYQERYIKAWPITRWYWKRKMCKAMVAVEKAKDFADKMKKDGMFEPLSKHDKQ